MAKALTKATVQALKDFNNQTGHAWDFGTEFSNKNKVFETFVNNFLFPKINETVLIESENGNRFDWLAVETDFIGQYSEEYVIMDTVPIDMDLSQPDTLMLKREYPKMATKLFGAGILKKLKFTLNNNSVRFNFATIGDAVKYALGVYKKKLSDINVSEETELKAMLIDYALNYVSDKRIAISTSDLIKKITTAVLNLQNNSSKHNETSTATGGAVGRYTTQTSLKDMLIVTTDEVKAEMLTSTLAQSFNVAGIDLTSHIISFDDLGGAWRLTKDVIVTQEIKEYMEAYGDYQIKVDDVIPKDSVFTYDISTKFGKANVEEIKPKNELFALITDVRAIRYKRYTKDMIKQFYNGEFDEHTYWLHYYSFKAVSPFYNKVLITDI